MVSKFNIGLLNANNPMNDGSYLSMLRVILIFFFFNFRFAEAKVVPPHKKIAIHPPTSSRSAKMATFECEICFLTLPKGVSQIFGIYSYYFLWFIRGLQISRAIVNFEGMATFIM